MYFKIKLDGGSTRLILPAENAGAILEALPHAFIVDESWDSSTPLKKLDAKIGIELIDDASFEELPEPMVKLQETLRAAESRWLEHYRNDQASKKELAELKKNLEDRGISIAPEETENGS